MVSRFWWLFEAPVSPIEISHSFNPEAPPKNLVRGQFSAPKHASLWLATNDQVPVVRMLLCKGDLSGKGLRRLPRQLVRSAARTAKRHGNGRRSASTGRIGDSSARERRASSYRTGVRSTTGLLCSSRLMRPKNQDVPRPSFHIVFIENLGSGTAVSPAK